MTASRNAIASLVCSGVVALLGGCGGSEAEIAKDEAAKRAKVEGKTVAKAAEAYTPSKIVDYFNGMDSVAELDPSKDSIPFPLLDTWKALPTAATTATPVQLSESEAFGRNTWMIWCAGNEGFWDYLAKDTFGFIDLLKLVDSRTRRTRFRDDNGVTAGVINEPEMRQATEASEFGLWLDLPREQKLRDWRKSYVDKTFAALKEGRHPTQRGLSTYKDPGRATPSNDGSKSRDAKGAGDSAYDDDAYGDSPPPEIYGLSSGIVGLRLFPNPYFGAAAQAKWDGRRYYTDKTYYQDPNLIRPYRVGVSCALCHASFHPLKPPRDVAEPEWENISGNIGAQYLRTRGTFGNMLEKEDFYYHVLDSQPPGTIDTSLIASDNINNPNTMNSVFALPQRLLLSFSNPSEKLSPPGHGQPSMWRTVDPNASNGRDRAPPAWRKAFTDYGLGPKLESSNANPRHVPRILLDGSDSVGAWIALARVYLNIGSYWERWIQLHQPVVGFTPQKPFEIKHCEANSVYWNATAARVGPMRDYFLKATPPMPLLATARAEERLKPVDEAALKKRFGRDQEKFEQAHRVEAARKIDVKKLKTGRVAFARNCIVCHSSVQPESSVAHLFGAEPGLAAKRDAFEKKYRSLIEQRRRERVEWANVGEFWEHESGQWLVDPDYRSWAEEVVELASFWKGNYLSTDYRIPVSLLKTNAARAMATNGLTGHMWEDFSSESYRKLPSPGPIDFFDPYKGPTGGPASFTPRHQTPPGAQRGGGGVGFYRVPTLISVWATAPFLHNNSLGLFNGDPSIDGRLAAYDDAIRKLLWPERRLESSSYNGATPERLKRDQGLIWRTPQDSYLRLAAKRVPGFARGLLPTMATSSWSGWFESATPKWLPTAVLLAIALVILAYSNSRHRPYAGWALLGAAIVWALVAFFFVLRPEDWTEHRAEVWPTIVAPGLVGLAGLVLLLINRPTYVRLAGYGAAIGALVVGFLIYFKSGGLGDLVVGPIPAGTPVNLIANFNAEAEPEKQLQTFRKVVGGLAEIRSKHLEGDQAAAVLREKIAPALMDVNKCPDFVMDKGHYFDWFKTMTDDDKESLIELLKTF